MRRVNLKRCFLYFIILVIIFNGARIIFDNEKEDDHIFKLDFTSEDRNWLLSLKTSRSKELPTVVVEEHYEVLQYWFQAAELDFIPRSKNILLHIDGHVDGAIPYDDYSIPRFRSPRDSDEIYIMMQRNDMFLVAAVITGFIDHVIWVWPTWDGPNHDGEDWSQLKYKVEIGISDPSLCFCWMAFESKGAPWNCHIRNTTCTEASDCPKIARNKCVIHSRVVLEVISESLASSILAKEKWPEGKGLILDIDEDFFGCWSDVIPLYEAGLTQNNLDVISHMVSSLFCASSATEEAVVDRVYVGILAFIRSLKFRSCVVQNEVNQGAGCYRLIDIENFLIENDKDIISFIKSRQTTNIFCTAEEKVEGLVFQSLFHYLLNFSIEQLDLLQQLGVCLGVSPSSPNYPTDGKFHVCHGENIPNKTLVPFHMPTEEEIDFRVLRFKQIITSAGKPPNIITISRSVRDGYTPKHFSNMIESRLIDNISKTYRRMDINGVYYDANLLGGKKGWHGRSQPLVPYFLGQLGYKGLLRKFLPHII